MSQNGYIKQSKTLRGSLIARGLDGRGIVSIAKTGTAGLVDTYTITYSDNTTSTFTVTNGANGEITSTSFAPVFSSSTAYAAGDYVVYSGQLYQFTAAHAAGAWAGTDATAVQIADQVSELKSALGTVYYESKLFAPAVGGAVSAYPTRIKIPDKTKFDLATTVWLYALPDTAFGNSYQVSYNVYDTDGTTTVSTSSGWKDYKTIGQIDIGEGQYLSLTTKFDPENVDTSQTGAVDEIKASVHFFTEELGGYAAALDANVKTNGTNITKLLKDSMTVNTNVQFYVSQTGTFSYKTALNGTCADGTTTFDSTAILLTMSNPMIVVRRPTSGYALKSETFNIDDICADIGTNRYTVIDNVKYIVLHGNRALCFDYVNYVFDVKAYNADVNGFVVLADQKSRQIDGGILAPKIFYDMLTDSDATIRTSVSTLASRVNGITANDYTFPTEQIIANRDLQNDSSLMFLWASDTHHQIHGTSAYGATTKMVAVMGQTAEQQKVDFAVVTGDIVNGYYPVDEQKSCLVSFVNTFRKYTDIPLLMAEGNHDDNSWYASANGSSGTEPTGLAQVLQNDQFTNYSMTNEIDSVQFDPVNPLGGYYYVDFRKAKIRAIVLNTEDIPYTENADHSLKYYGQWTFGFQEEQLDWLANHALKFTESGWGIILFMHYDSNFTINTTAQKNITNLNAIISAFIGKTSGTTTSTETDFALSVAYDFTGNASNEVIAWFSGHRHEDNNETISGVPHVMIINEFNGTGGGHDIVTIDRENKKIYTKRYSSESGALTTLNREISYGS